MKKILFLTLSAFLFSLSFPGFLFVKGCGLFAWFCLVPLFLALEDMSLENSFVYGIFYGALSYGLLCFWLWSYSPWMLLLASGFYGFCYAVLFVLLKIPTYSMKGFSFLCQVFILSAFDFIKTRGFLGFSYGVLGYSQWKNIPLIQVSDLTGVYGISFLVILCNGILYALIKALQNWKNQKIEFREKAYSIKKNFWIVPGISGAVFVILILGTIVYGFSKSKKITLECENLLGKKVILIQHNENPREDGVNVYAKNISQMMELTDEALSLYPDADLVVWPETAVTPSIVYQYYSGKDSRRISIVKSLLEYMEKKDCSFVVGNYHAVPEKGTNVTKDYNAAMYFTPKKNLVPPEPEMYFKQHLVPLSESFPVEKYFPKAGEFLKKLGANFWVPGTESKVFYKEELSFGTPICFEDTFPDVTRKMYKNGARCFVNLTNDSWSRSRACQYQHLSMAVFRSAETRCPTVRSATSGQTAIIGPEGKVLKETVPFTKSFIYGEIPLVKDHFEETFYCKNGDLFSFIIVVFSLVLLLIGVIKGIIKIWQNK